MHWLQQFTLKKDKILCNWKSGVLKATHVTYTWHFSQEADLLLQKAIHWLQQFTLKKDGILSLEEWYTDRTDAYLQVPVMVHHPETIARGGDISGK